MNRKDWLKTQRRTAEEGYSNRWASRYDEIWGVYSNASHREFIQKFLQLLPKPGDILDAACGTGRYISMLLEQGHQVTGRDQAQGMLDRARKKFPTVRLEKRGLQEIDDSQTFDGILCVDALEHVPPEDWPPILANFYRALKPGATLYFTVELADECELERAYRNGQELGLPAVYGEWINDEVYHYYPSLGQVREWLLQSGFEPVEEGQGDGYQHFLALKG